MSLRQTTSYLLSRFEKKLTPLNRLEINSSAILTNYDQFQQLAPQCQIWPVLKSNAYGHGLREVATILSRRQFTYLVVDSFFEALQVKHPCLIIGATLPQNLHLLDLSQHALMVQDSDTITALGQLRIPVKIHLKINTGLNRQGIEIEEISSYLSQIRSYPNLILEGVMSHLADGDNPRTTNPQLTKFLATIATIPAKYVHLSATDGINLTHHPKINVVRLGLGLYSNSLRLISTITKIRSVSPGDYVGYDRTYRARRHANIATIPLGYYEALDRRLSNSGFVKYQNKFLPIIGRVCMNMIIVNLLDTQAKLWDEVEVISPNSEDKNSIESIAKLIDASPYELFTRLSPTIRRVVL